MIKHKIELSKDEKLISDKLSDDREQCMNYIKEKYQQIKKNNNNNSNIINMDKKEIKYLRNVLEDSLSLNLFKNYINEDFLDDCELKIAIKPEEFYMEEDKCFNFGCFMDRKKKKINAKNKMSNNKNTYTTDAKKNKKRIE